jgi:hypothetical protein
MKKLLLIALVMMVMAIAAPAFATQTISAPTGTTIAGSVFTPSANVTISIVSTATDYSATSAHSSSRTGAGYQFWILNTYNGIQKSAYAGEAANVWPAVVTTSTGTVAGTWN